MSRGRTGSERYIYTKLVKKCEDSLNGKILSSDYVLELRQGMRVETLFLGTE